MARLTNFTGNQLINFISGGVTVANPTAVYAALFTGVGLPDGTGFTEVAGNGYARAQIAGSSTTNATTSNSTTISFASLPAWVTQGMYVYNTTHAVFPANTFIISISSNNVTLNAAPTGGGVQSGDTIIFSAFATPSGTPAASASNCTVVFPKATGSGLGTVIAFGLYDASTSGDLLTWDFMLGNAWTPFTSSAVGSGNGAVFTQHAHGFSNGTPIVCSAEFGGVLPTTTQGGVNTYTINYTANVTTDTFTLSSSSSAPTTSTA